MFLGRRLGCGNVGAGVQQETGRRGDEGRHYGRGQGRRKKQQAAATSRGTHHAEQGSVRVLWQEGAALVHSISRAACHTTRCMQ